MKNIIVTGSYGKSSAVCLLEKLAKTATSAFTIYKYRIADLQEVQVHPDIVLITNVSSYPLQGVKSYKEYIEKIDALLRQQTEEDLLILNADYTFLLPMLKHAAGVKQEIFHTHGSTTGCTVYDKEHNTLSIRDSEGKMQPVIAMNRLKLPGLRNNEVYFAAAAAMKGFVNISLMETVLADFRGAPHHFEYVGQWKNGSIFNNAHSFVPSSAVYSLMPFYQRIIFITGGKLSDYPYHGLGLINAAYVKELILVGESADAIEASTKAANCYEPDRTHIYKVKYLKEAVQLALKVMQEGDIVMFAPSTPLEDYDSYLECGQDYKTYMRELGVK